MADLVMFRRLCAVTSKLSPVVKECRSDDGLGDAVGITVRRRSPVLQITFALLPHLTNRSNTHCATIFKAKTSINAYVDSHHQLRNLRWLAVS